MALNSQGGDSDGSTMSIFTTAATRTITIQEGELTQTNQQDTDERGTLNDPFQQWIESTVPQISEITDTSANHSFLLALGLSEHDIAIMDSCIPLPEQHTSRSLTSEVFPESSGEQTSHDILLLTDRPKDRPSEAPRARKQECDKHRPSGVSSKPYRPPTPPAPTGLPHWRSSYPGFHIDIERQRHWSPYACCCGRTFSRTQSLRLHQKGMETRGVRRCHTALSLPGEKHFWCTRCEWMASTFVDLRRHLYSKHVVLVPCRPLKSR
ncbi:hypothetical protein DFP72DRAFT_1049017 [Ephemerocybe angulata]|uniref:C2H2-type domain-containing protein n=1 Tax=Ephemerocybe angulata TaxID=980116 RepID=A0A8H6HN54_9AGAR|nr:hypothetical protein DFP72DRAFT_1049017 [Tulosesus angulatus]